jgi:transposase
MAKVLKVPENISLLYLPAYSPELNALERLWGYMKSHYLSNRAYTDYDDLLNPAETRRTELPLRSSVLSVTPNGYRTRINQNAC